MAQHTPGPWKLSEYGQIIDPAGTSLSLDGSIISVTGGVSVPSPATAESNANRDLIVQAPAMKQALLDLLNWYDMDEGDLRLLMIAARGVVSAAGGE